MYSADVTNKNTFEMNDADPDFQSAAEVSSTRRNRRITSFQTFVSLLCTFNPTGVFSPLAVKVHAASTTICTDLTRCCLISSALGSIGNHYQQSEKSMGWEPQWKQLLGRVGGVCSQRCCLVCQGSGRLASRKRRLRQRHDPDTALVPCAACDGVGLLPFPHSLAPDSSPKRSMSTADGVAIVGGGIGGLALALALQQRNISCTVFERDGSFAERAQGYGLTLQQGSRAIRALGLSADVVGAGLASTAHYCFDALTGSLIGSHGAASRGDVGAAGGPTVDLDERAIRKRNIHLPRQSLRALLFRKLRPGTVRWGCRFVNASLSPTPGTGVEICFGHMNHGQQENEHEKPEQMETVKAAVLVGCDGIRSAVREALVSSTSPTLCSLEVMVILGFAAMGPEEPLFATDDKVVEWVDGVSRLYSMPFEQGVTMWQLSFPCKADDARALGRSGKVELLAEAQRRVKGWPASAVQLIRMTGADVVTGYPCYDREVDYAGGVEDGKGAASGLNSCSTLLGDAAHPMAPFKGQGANQALLDAIELARALYESEFGDAASSRNAAMLQNAVGSGLVTRDAESRFANRKRLRSRQALAAALRSYEQASTPRARSKVMSSRKSTPLLHSPSARAVSEKPMTRAAASAVAFAAST